MWTSSKCWPMPRRREKAIRCLACRKNSRPPPRNCATGCRHCIRTTRAAGMWPSTRDRWRRISTPTRMAAVITIRTSTRTATPMQGRAPTIATVEQVATSHPTRIEVVLVDGRARIKHIAHGELLAARPLRMAGRHVRIALVGIRTTPLAGDALALQIRVGPGVVLEIIEPTGMVAYDGAGRRADWRAELDLGAGATLIWHARPFVAARGSNAHRSTNARLAADARLLLKELLV